MAPSACSVCGSWGYDSMQPRPLWVSSQFTTACGRRLAATRSLYVEVAMSNLLSKEVCCRSWFLGMAKTGLQQGQSLSPAVVQYVRNRYIFLDDLRSNLQSQSPFTGVLYCDRYFPSLVDAAGVALLLHKALLRWVMMHCQVVDPQHFWIQILAGGCSEGGYRSVASSVPRHAVP